MVTMSDSIPRTGSAWIDQSMEPHTIGDDYVTAIRARIAVRILHHAPESSYAGRDEFVTWCRWEADRERHRAYVERHVAYGLEDMARGYERAAVLLDQWGDRYDVTAWN